MYRDTSQKSVRSLNGFSVTSRGSGELSAFEEQLPQTAESLAVQINQSQRYPGSLLVDSLGQPTGVMRDMALVEPKRYELTVEPHVRTVKAKDIIRESARMRTDIEFDIELTRANPSLADGLVDERFMFRRERAKHFQMGRQFPALATPRLMPSWALSEVGRQSALQADSAQPSRGQRKCRGPSEHLTRETASHRKQHHPRHEDHHNVPWLVSGTSGATELISDRRPTLFQDSYEDPIAQVRAKEAEGRRRLQEEGVGPVAFMPGCPSDAKAICDRSRLNSQKVILPEWLLFHAMNNGENNAARRLIDKLEAKQKPGTIKKVREYGRRNVQALKDRYAEKRRHFQSARTFQPVSSFDRFVFEKEMEMQQQELLKQKTHKLDTSKREHGEFHHLSTFRTNRSGDRAESRASSKQATILPHPTGLPHPHGLAHS